jgi:hypothetical protein
MKSRSRAWNTLACIALLTFAGAASAGLPMTCHPLYIGDAPLLPWGKDGWRSPDPAYDVRNLTRDTLRLLEADAPILARMENLRRASLYAVNEPALAAQLLQAMITRAAAGGPANRLAWFDAAYTIETLKQAGGIDRRNPLAGAVRPATAYQDLNDLDGYRMLGTLLAREGESAEIEFARGLMMRNGSEQKHLRKAAQLATPGSQLARNLPNFLY